MSKSLSVNRMTPSQVEQRREKLVDADTTGAGAIWRTCRNCGDEIEASEKNHAYCDPSCKKESAREEMF